MTVKGSDGPYRNKDIETHKHIKTSYLKVFILTTQFPLKLP